MHHLPRTFILLCIRSRAEHFEQTDRCSAASLLTSPALGSTGPDAMAELKPETRVAIYGRVSTRDKGQEVENQLAQLREFGAKQGWTISCEYADRESGANRDRIEFQEMFRDAAHRRFDLLLIWSLDRFTREGVLETLTLLNRLTGAGVGYRSFTEPYFDSCRIFKDAVRAGTAIGFRKP